MTDTRSTIQSTSFGRITFAESAVIPAEEVEFSLTRFIQQGATVTVTKELDDGDFTFLARYEPV